MYQILLFPELCFHNRIQQYHGACRASFDEYCQQPTAAHSERKREHSDLEQPLHPGEQGWGQFAAGSRAGAEVGSRTHASALPVVFQS